MGLVYYNWRYYNARSGRWLCRDYISEESQKALYSFLMNYAHDIDNLGLSAYEILSDILAHSEGTYEITSPAPLWGGYPFISFTLSNWGDYKKKITFAFGVSWGLDKILSKIPKIGKIGNFPKLKRILNLIAISVYGSTEGTARCFCIDFCEVALNLSVIIGEGRRGGNKKDIGFVDGTKLTLGASLEGKGALNICTGKFSAQFNMVISMGVKAHTEILGYKFEHEGSYDFVISHSVESNEMSFLKLAKSC